MNSRTKGHTCTFWRWYLYKIIEVKSRWWWDGNGSEKYKSRLKNNLKKRQAVLDKGYIYELWLFENKNNYKILKNDTDFQT
jgi:hypothetical protein